MTTRTHRNRLLAATTLTLTGALAGCTAAPSTDPDGETSTSTGPDGGTSTATEDAAQSADPEPTSAAPEQTSQPPEPEPTALGAWGVSSGHPSASEVGLEILEEGGSAVDAAVATAFADSVVQPVASGIGGGGAAIIVDDGNAEHYDYREYVNASGDIPEDGVGVPGFVAGLVQMHEEHGTLPWADLVEPAIALAEEGAPVSDFLVSTIDSPLGEQATADLDHFRRADGSALQAGDLLVQEDLATTMRAIAEDPGTVYDGDLTQELVQVPGLDRETLANYQVEVYEPVSGTVGDFTMLSGAPALPGAAIIQMIQIAEAAGIGEIEPDSADFVDVQTQAWQIADTSVQQLFGDPAYVDVPVERLTDPEANSALAADLPGGLESSAASAALDSYDGAPNTTHISVVDADGMAVSMTNTVTSYWGSGRYLGGFFLNDQLGRFLDIGSSEANTPEPGRRSVTWSSPSMVLDEQERPVLILGTPGGRQIPNTLASVVTRWALHDQDLSEIVPAERFVLTDGILWLESERLVSELTTRGYDARALPPASISNLGSVQALEVDWEGRSVDSHADHRRAAGFAVASEEEPEPRTGP